MAPKTFLPKRPFYPRDLFTQETFAPKRPLQPRPAVTQAPPGSVQTQIPHFRFEPVEGFVAFVHHDGLGVEIVVERLLTEFATGAGILDAAPWRGRIDPMMVVDPDDASLKIFGETKRARHVVGAHRGGQAIL